MTDNLVSAKRLSKIFRVKRKKEGLLNIIGSVLNPDYHDVAAVKEISFSIAKGDIVAFIGPNGAGKSTTVKMLTGILFPSSGVVSVCGMSPTSEREKLAFKIGAVFGQKSQLWYHLPAVDSFKLLAKIYELDHNAFQNRLNFLLDFFEIHRFSDTPVRKLSLGQRMRCELVASLLHKPEVLFLDEPTIGMDIVVKQQVRDLIRFFNREEHVTVFLTSHDAGDIADLANRAIIINKGELLQDCSIADLRTKYLRTKTVRLMLTDASDFKFDGVRVIEKSKHQIVLETAEDTLQLDKLLRYTISNYEVQDIVIEPPPMEEIIATIYKGFSNEPA